MICRRDGRQLVGNGNALYELRGLPKLKPEEMLVMFDVKENDVGNWYVPGVQETAHYDFENDASSEEELRMDLPTIGYLGDTLRPLETENGQIIFINNDLLKPIESDMMRLSLRRTEGGTPYVVVKDGFLFEAMIMPYETVTETLCDNMHRLWKACCMTANRWKEKEEKEEN